MRFLQGNLGHQTLPPVLPRGLSLSMRPIDVTYAWSIMSKRDVIHKTGNALRIALSVG